MKVVRKAEGRPHQIALVPGTKHYDFQKVISNDSALGSAVELSGSSPGSVLSFRRPRNILDTSTISYRVADFLKKHPPFQAVEEGDLLELAARGRVRFHEANEYILWQGEPHKLHVFVIQQGTVSLWDEADGRAVLRDVRGPGDMLGIERFNDAPWCLHSARSASDVVIYSFPASDFEELVLKYPYARRFVEAHDTVSADFEWAKDTRAPQDVFLHDVVGRKPLESCSAHTSVRDAATLDADHRVRRHRRRGREPSRPGRGDPQRRTRMGCRGRRGCRPADHRSAARCPAGGRVERVCHRRRAGDGRSRLPMPWP